MLVSGLDVDRARLAKAAADPLLLATDAAEALVRDGMPFRDAHEQVAESVRDGSFKKPRKGAKRPAPGPGGIRDALDEARHRFVDNLGEARWCVAYAPGRSGGQCRTLRASPAPDADRRAADQARQPPTGEQGVRLEAETSRSLSSSACLRTVPESRPLYGLDGETSSSPTPLSHAMARRLSASFRLSSRSSTVCSGRWRPSSETLGLRAIHLVAKRRILRLLHRRSGVGGLAVLRGRPVLYLENVVHAEPFNGADVDQLAEARCAVGQWCGR
jgi:hypothetical protein